MLPVGTAGVAGRPEGHSEGKGNGGRATGPAESKRRQVQAGCPKKGITSLSDSDHGDSSSTNSNVDNYNNNSCNDDGGDDSNDDGGDDSNKNNNNNDRSSSSSRRRSSNSSSRKKSNDKDVDVMMMRTKMITVTIVIIMPLKGAVLDLLQSTPSTAHSLQCAD